MKISQFGRVCSGGFQSVKREKMLNRGQEIATDEDIES
jgi:hypothetical protein